MEGVSLGELRCQCGNNASATPYQVLINEEMARLHVNVERHGCWYVAVVLALYVVGVVLIVRWEGYQLDTCSLTSGATTLAEFVSCGECTDVDGDSSGDEGAPDPAPATHPATHTLQVLVMITHEDCQTEDGCCSTTV